MSLTKKSKALYYSYFMLARLIFSKVYVCQKQTKQEVKFLLILNISCFLDNNFESIPEIISTNIIHFNLILRIYLKYLIQS
jgi:hypothetical protein